MWPLLHFVFWSSAAILALVILFFWDESIQPEQPVIGEKATSSRKTPFEKTSSEDKKKAADIESLSLPLQDLNLSDTENQPAKALEDKGLFEEILSNSQANAAKTPSEGDAVEKAITDKAAKNADKKEPLLLPINEGKPQNFNSVTASDRLDMANPNSLPSILPTSGLPSGIELYKAMTGFNYPTDSSSFDATAAAAAAALANPLAVAIQRNQTNSVSSLSAQSKSVSNSSVSPLSPVTPRMIQPTYPTAFSWQTQTPGVTSFASPSTTPQLAPTLLEQVSSFNNSGLSSSTGLTPGLTPTIQGNPNSAAANSYSYLIGSQQDRLGINAEQGGVLDQIGNFNNSGASIYYNNLSESTSLNPTAASPEGRLPYSGASQGRGWTSAPNSGRALYSETTPGTGWVSTPPISPLLPNTPNNFGQFFLPRASSESTLTAPPQAVESSTPASGLNQGSRANTSGVPQVTVPIVPANYRESPLPSFSQGAGVNTPYGNTSVPTPQPTQTPNTSLPRPIPGRYIGGGQINTFSNP